MVVVVMSVGVDTTSMPGRVLGFKGEPKIVKI